MGLLLVGLAIIGLIPTVFIIDGFIEGQVQAKGGSYSRTEEPAWFWATIGMYAALLAFIGYLALDLAFSD